MDLVIILLVLLVAAGATYKFTNKSAQGENKTVEVQILVPCIRPELAQAVKVGDRMVQGSSYTSVVVKSVEITPGFSVNTDSRGLKVEAYDPYLKDLMVTVEGNTVLSSASISLGGQEIRVGKDYFVKSLTYDLKGLITIVTIK